MPQLAISALGSPRITLDGRLIDGFRTDKARALLVYLAVERARPHPRQVLAGLLWPDVPESNARHSLSQVLSELRSLTGDRRASAEGRPRLLQATRQSVALNPESPCSVDACTFDALLRRWTSQSSADAGDGESLAPLVQAASLYQGAFLEGFSIGDAYPFEEWMLLQRERLQRRAIETLRRLSTSYAEAGDHATALKYAWRWVEMDPWQEAAQRTLIRLLALSGRRSTAIRQYELCRQILRENLGVDPEPATVTLVEQVRRGEIRANPPAPSRGGTPLPSPVAGEADTVQRHNLPAQLTPLVGREAELTLISERLAEPACRLLTLVGPGGIGKTRLALAVAHGQLDAYADGVYLVPLAQVPVAQGIVPSIAQAIGLTIASNDISPSQQLQAYLKSKAMLLMLDNMEHLVDGVGLLADVLAAAPGVTMLATSRIRLGALCETIIAVEPLALPDDTTPADRAGEAGAVRLFVQGVRRSRRDFRLSPETAPAVVGICRAVGGVPLALLLAASWCDMLSVGEIRDHLTADRGADDDGTMAFLRAQWRDVPQRHRSMRAVFDQSWRLLGEREREITRVLGVFRGTISIDAASFVAGATLHDLRSLVDQSMLAAEAGGRYGIHPLFREYLLVRLARDPEAERAAHDRHAAHHVSIVRRWLAAAKGPLQVAALAEMDANIDDARAAWDWIVEQGDVAQMAQAVDGLLLYYTRRARSQEAESACQAAVKRLENLTVSDATTEVIRTRTMVRLLLWQSEARTGAAAEEAIDRALDVLTSPALQAADVRSERGWALRRRADLLWNTDRDRARADYEESLAVLEGTDDWWEQARTLDRLADLELLFADFDAAGRHSEALLAIARAHGDLHAMAWGLHAMAGKTLYQSQLEESIRLATESLGVRRELGDPHEVVVGLQYLGTRWLVAGRLELAMPLYQEAADILDGLGRPAPYPRGVLAWGLMLDGRYDAAEGLARRAVGEAEAAGVRRLVAWSSHVLGGLALVRGAVDDAIERLTRSADDFRDMSEWIFWGMIFSFLGYAHYVAGHREQAQGILTEALKVGVKIGIPPIFACALPGITLLYADAGRAERVVALNAVVRQCCLFVVNSKWFADVAGPDYQAAIDALEPEQVEAAEALVLTSDMKTEAQVVLSELIANSAT